VTVECLIPGPKNKIYAAPVSRPRRGKCDCAADIRNRWGAFGVTGETVTHHINAHRVSNAVVLYGPVSIMEIPIVPIE
jgi:hypothetical protein